MAEKLRRCHEGRPFARPPHNVGGTTALGGVAANSAICDRSTAMGDRPTDKSATAFRIRVRRYGALQPIREHAGRQPSLSTERYVSFTINSSRNVAIATFMGSSVRVLACVCVTFGHDLVRFWWIRKRSFVANLILVLWR